MIKIEANIVTHIREFKTVAEANRFKETLRELELRDWAYAKIEEVIDSRKFDYADNYRWCIAGDKSGMWVYDQSKKNGCCGSFDSAAHHPSGVRIKFGFNHGH